LHFHFYLINPPNSAILPFQNQAASSSPPFVVNDPTAEKGDEASSNQALSEESQAKLKEVLSLLQRDIQDQVRDVDRLGEVLESIDQELPDEIKASLEPISHLDNHYAAVRRALKNQSSRPVLEQTLVQYSTSMTKRFGHGTCKFGHGTLFYDQLMTKLNWSQKLRHI
jgi:predicted RNase H-like nuclease (RuvC/YqgF family)